MRLRDLTGQTFGRWYVLERAEDYVDSKGNHYVQWKCQCQCKDKTIKNIIMSRLTRGTSKSCGCLQKELLSQRRKKHNKYDLTGEYGIGWTSNTNEEFYFDLEDYDKIKDYCWLKNTNKKKYSTYYNLIARVSNSKTIRMHQIITGKKNQDHINHNTLDNRKCNLRDSTIDENMKNKNKRKDNKSGITGVYWNKKEKKWIASIQADKNPMRLGAFINKEDAIKVRLKAEKEYFGEFAPQKHLYEQYDIN